MKHFQLPDSAPVERTHRPVFIFGCWAVFFYEHAARVRMNAAAMHHRGRQTMRRPRCLFKSPGTPSACSFST